MNVRLPETDEEYALVSDAVDTIRQYMRPGCSPQGFVDDLRALVVAIETWWDHRRALALRCAVCDLLF